jgi:hypothetical protein
MFHFRRAREVMLCFVFVMSAQVNDKAYVKGPVQCTTAYYCSYICIYEKNYNAWHQQASMLEFAACTSCPSVVPGTDCCC